MRKAFVNLLVIAMVLPSVATAQTVTTLTISTATITNGSTVSVQTYTVTNISVNTDTATSAPVAGTPGSAPAGQAGAQQNAGNTNNLASALGKAAGVLSMAAGGLYIAKGAQEISCCMQGCKTDEKESVAEQALQDAKAKEAAGAIDHTNPALRRQPIDYFKLRFPDEARNMCPRPRGPGFMLLFDLFQPPKAEAAGCIGAMITLATGGLMMLNGILGMAAADKAAQAGAAAMNNSTGMGSLNMPSTLTPGDGSGNSSTNSNLGSGLGADTIKMDPALLRTGKADAIMGQFEKKFGISRESFADKVTNSEDPRAILNKAPRNPLSAADINKAINAAKNMSESDKAAALARTGINEAQNELGAKLGGAGTTGSGLVKAKFGDEKEKDVALDTLDTGRTPAEAEAMTTSPEVRAALLAKELENARLAESNFTLFQIVHKKYREKTKSIFGYDPDGAMKGVGNADGF